MRQEGRSEDAAEIAARKKPTLPAWLAGQLGRREPKAVERLLAAGTSLVEAQRSALGGGGGPDRLREAMAAERDAVHELVARAREIAAEGGRPVSGAMLDRLVETLRAAAVDPQGKEELARGCVSREYERSGFDALGILGGAPAQTAPAPADELAERRRRRDEAQAKVRELRAAGRAAAREAVAAEAEAERAEREAERARERADELQSEVERLEEELEAAEAELKPRR